MHPAPPALPARTFADALGKVSCDDGRGAHLATLLEAIKPASALGGAALGPVVALRVLLAVNAVARLSLNFDINVASTRLVRILLGGARLPGREILGGALH